MRLSKSDVELVVGFQKSEITEHFVYKALAESSSGTNKEILLKIASDELAHYNIWKNYSKRDVGPDKKRLFFYRMLAKLFGVSFAVKLMEKNELAAEQQYRQQIQKFKDAEPILRDEITHENLLLSMIEERKIAYMSSIVLGLNDALVELSGTLAGLSFALRNSKLIGLAGVITGVAAAMSMASAEYLSQKSEKQGRKNPLLAALFTGVAYVITVIILVFPYLVLANYLWALLWSVFNGIFAVILFSFFISIINDRPFKKVCFEMLGLNFGVILLSFGVGLLVRKWLGVDL